MMKKFIYIFLVLFLVSCGSDKTSTISTDTNIATSNSKVTVQSILSNLDNAKFKEGELLVKFKSGVLASTSLRTHEIVGASVAKRFTIVSNLEHVKLPEDISVKDAIVTYMSDPNVEYAEPNYLLSPAETIPNDLFFHPQQWALRNTGLYADGIPGADIQATDAWDISTGSDSIVIAVLDTGIDYNHQDLVGNIWQNTSETSCTDGIDNDLNGYIDDCRGWDFVGTDYLTSIDDNDPMDEYGHGTHVAGTIGATGNNGEGVCGVMWNVKLMALKFLDATGYGIVSDEIAGIQYAVAEGARIINASFGSSAYSSSEYNAINSARSAGVLVIAAAGNGGSDGIGDNNDNFLTPMYPASYDLSNIIAVAATDQHDRRVSFSNYGLTSVDVAAPGVWIFSTVPYQTYNRLEFYEGTSMSAPHVSGLAGLLYSYYTNFTYSQNRGTILRYVDVLPTLTGWIKTGGRINAYKAISSLLTPTYLTASAASPSAISLSWTDNATGEDGYRIERRTGAGSYTEIATIGANAESYTDSSLIDGTTYTYRVRAYNTIPANSLYSNAASATTPVNPPTGLIAAALSGSQVSLSWTDNSLSEDGYKIERQGPGDTSFAQIAMTGPNTTAYTDSGLSPSTSYTYRVRAYNSAAGNSSYSNEDSAKTLTASGNKPGGGNCSIGARQNTPTAMADIALILLPLVYIAMMRRKRRYKD